MDTFDKLQILSSSAKYDVSCSSSGVDREGIPGGIGSAASCGICHSFAADGRCISLLKVLYTNNCVYDCKYCVNRRSNDLPRATFTPRELADLTINFYRRNYIEGLFLSSAVFRTPDYTSERLIETLAILRNEYKFGGYIHVKAIPGTDSLLIDRLGHLADRMSVNIELPSQHSLTLLAPDKTKESILRPMGHINTSITENKTDIVKYKHSPKFVPGGQSTQMIIGATPETDLNIIKLSEALYKKYSLKRVYYSAYMPVQQHSLLPSLDTKPPLMREHRLYQADWLLRFYHFSASELLDANHQNFNLFIDPKCNWALNHMQDFPVEINKAPYEVLLRVPGIGVRSAKRIMMARRSGKINFEGLKKIGATLKRAQYFITCDGKMIPGLIITPEAAMRSLISDTCQRMGVRDLDQLSLFDSPPVTREDVLTCLTGQM
ncbi:MAG: putative DNA modification/repair radical SAM protein [Bacillota bacterium]|nr:putative DNA modification/repair radical SAM protein [Bacillota bacterium]